MSAYIVALTGAGTAMAVGLVTVARSWPHPTGRHRAPAAEQPPVQALEMTAALCATERRVTVHARTHITRQLICMDCATPAPTRSPSTPERRPPVPELTLFPPETPAAVLTAGPRPGPVPKVIGLDVAMGITGIAGEGWTDYIKAKGASQHSRFEQQLAGIADHTRHADFVVIEGAAFSKNNQGADALSAMRWMVRHQLWKRRIPYAVVHPDHRIIYAVGTAAPKDPETGLRLKGIPLKAVVRQAVEETYGITTEGDAKYDEADAYILLAMGLHWLGWPLAVVGDDRRRALDAVRWPAREAVTAR